MGEMWRQASRHQRIVVGVSGLAVIGTITVALAKAIRNGGIAFQSGLFSVYVGEAAKTAARGRA